MNNRESAEIERLERFAADLIDGRRDWTDIMVSYKTNSNLVKHSIWLISFCSWFPLLNLLLTMSTYEGLLESHTGKDNKSKCDQIGIENALVNIPLCIYQFNVFSQCLFVQRNSKLNFGNKVRLYLILLYIFGSLKGIERWVIVYAIEYSDESNNT